MNDVVRLQVELANAKPFLSIQDVALLSGYSISSIRRKMDLGQIRYIQDVPKGKLLFRRADIFGWLDGTE